MPYNIITYDSIIVNRRRKNKIQKRPTERTAGRFHWALILLLLAQQPLLSDQNML